MNDVYAINLARTILREGYNEQDNNVATRPPGGTSSTLNASPTHAAGSRVLSSGLHSLGRSSFAADKDKHSCKGKNDCKGQGGCKSSDNGCKAKNSCKGKGGCATDGSKPPKF